MLALVIVGLGATALAWTAGGRRRRSRALTLRCRRDGSSASSKGSPHRRHRRQRRRPRRVAGAEGGSTNNTAAFNPFNTGVRPTSRSARPGRDTANNSRPSPTGQPDVRRPWPRSSNRTCGSSRLRLAGRNVTPASAFLAVVDQSAWCAANPGRAALLRQLARGASTSLPASLPVSSALNVYGNVTSDLQSYQRPSRQWRQTRTRWGPGIRNSPRRRLQRRAASSEFGAASGPARDSPSAST